MGHIFISYSHKDSEYVHKLADALQKEGFEVWIDDRIHYGSEWPKIVTRNLDSSDGVIVVLSNNSYESDMVQNEVARAREEKKPIFPLLLEGKNWLIVQAKQFVDIRDGSLPTEKFYKRLENITPRKKRERKSKHIAERKTNKAIVVVLVSIIGIIVAVFLAIFSYLPAKDFPTSPTPTLYPRPVAVYDFVVRQCDASWSSAAGELPCPGIDSDANGFTLKLTEPKLESGVIDSLPSLLVFPQYTFDGYIKGIYPAFKVETGDYFRAIVGCDYEAISCSVIYRLDYQVENDSIHTFWAFVEKHDGITYDANLDLSPLAGQNVKLILTVLSSGAPVDDRALWIAPMIVRNGCTNRVQFVSNLTVPDGTVFSPGEKFTKTTQLSNSGTCTWSTDYALVFEYGDDMNGAHHTRLPVDVAPGGIVDISSKLQAPLTLGAYTGYWKLSDPSGAEFGVGPMAIDPWWVNIRVDIK